MLNEAVAGPSGARLTGDDLQHAIAWHSALLTQWPGSGVISVTVEAVNAGNVDDIVIKRATGYPDEYIQVKATTSAKRPVSMAWLMEPSPSGGPSIIQRFRRTAQELLKDGRHPRLTLITNRSIDPGDPLLTLRDRNDCLAGPLRVATGKAVAARDELARHLDCTLEELYAFLEHFRLCTDASEMTWRERVAQISYAAGVRADEAAFRLGIAEVREWVKTDRLPRTRADVAKAIENLGLRAGEPATVVVINALDDHHFSALDNAPVLDWAPYFRGTEARDRRGLKDPAGWNALLRPQLMNLARSLRGRGPHRVIVTGTMRLPTWFAAGVAFQESAGFVPAKMKEDTLWTKPQKPLAPVELELSRPFRDLPRGRDVALALAISTDLTSDVKAYLADAEMDLPLITVRPPGGPSNASINSCAHAYAMALWVRDLAREINRVVRPPVLHLFMATPAAFALLLGGVWDRVPTTQTYEDLSSVGYEPAFLFPN